MDRGSAAPRRWRRRALLLLGAGGALLRGGRAQETYPWLSTREEQSYGWLSLEREHLCRHVPEPPPKLDELEPYPAVAHEAQPNFGYRQLVKQWRGQNGLQAVMQDCPLAGESTAAERSQCSRQQLGYLSGLAPVAAPLALSCIFALVWKLCCWVAFCRCCRRCCICAERKGPRQVSILLKLAAVLSAFLGTVVVFVTAWVAYSMSIEVSNAISNSLCHLISMADETLNGNGQLPVFLGVDEAIQRMRMLRQHLDVDGQAMMDLRNILDDTAEFSIAMDDLTMKISHMRRMLTLVGQHKIKEHSCWFCERAVGNNATGERGLLTDIVSEVQRSSADAMRQVQRATTATLTGDQLIQISAAVKKGSDGLEVFKHGYAGAYVEGLLSQRETLQRAEDSRHTLFQCMCAFCIVHAVVVSNGTIFLAKRSTAKYPTATPACVSWFCGFCGLALALLFAGVLLLAAVPLSELCSFWRYELLDSEGPTEYYRQMGLYDPSDPSKHMDQLAVDVFQACLTPEGSGEILRALGLDEQLKFQELLDRRFIELEDKMAGRVVDTAKFELLVSQARTFGGLFTLNPDEPLPLAPTAVAMMIGSSVDPDDREGPDGESLIYGLNTYAALIAGPGQYSFQNGTSGGGTLITALTPTEAEASRQPLTTQHALTYARLKEQLLSEPAVLRCDVMDSRYHVTKRTCGFREYKKSVVAWATQVKEAGLKLGVEAQKARPIIAMDLRSSLHGVLMEVRKLRTHLRCRFLWRRWEDLDLQLCNHALPGMLQGFAAWMAMACGSFILVVLHYKIWRHLLDNKVVGEELDRFSEKYKYLQSIKA